MSRATGDVVALCEESVAYALANLEQVDDADLDRSTPCADWDLGRLILHLADSADALTGLIMTGELSFPTPPRTVDAEPVKVAQRRLRRLSEALGSAGELGSAGNEAWVTAAAQAGAIEFATHGWDVATARLDDRPVPEALATALVQLTAELIDDDARGTSFAPRTPVPDRPTPSDRLIAFLGRSPR